MADSVQRTADSKFKYLTWESIEWNQFLPKGRQVSVGASVLFLGTVRSHSESRSVLYLEYEAYEAMAERMIRDLTEEAREKWPLEGVRVLHRLGRVALGEITVAIEVRSAHRDEAYRASRYLIEEIKHKVPIWKKEYFSDGTSEWSQCPHAELQRSA